MGSVCWRLLGAHFKITVLLVTLSIAFADPALLQALPAKGTPAPPLEFEQLLQAPKGTHTDWAALRGKVVVLEFWATWCGPCVAAIPHLNALAASLDPGKFQFISVDDEAPAVVESFLAKRPMSGWIGIDSRGADFAWYGADARPTTVIVDGKGRVIAATSPDSLKTADLLAVSEGKSVEFEPAVNMQVLQAAVKSEEGAKPIFEILLSKSTPDAKFFMTAGSSGLQIHAASAKFLLTYVYRIPWDRLIVADTLPEDSYDFRAKAAGVEESVAFPMYQTAVAAGLNLRAETKNETRKVYVLKATDAARDLLIPTVSNGGGMSTFGNGKINLVSTSMENFAVTLEGALQMPVVNETGVDGRFDVEVEFPDKDAEAAKAVLLKKLGLSLELAERSITVVDVATRKDLKAEDKSLTKPVAR